MSSGLADWIGVRVGDAGREMQAGGGKGSAHVELRVSRGAHLPRGRRLTPRKHLLFMPHSRPTTSFKLYAPASSVRVPPPFLACPRTAYRLANARKKMTKVGRVRPPASCSPSSYLPCHHTPATRVLNNPHPSKVRASLRR